jgi:Uncharacterised nucleotidyltransferase
VRPEAALLLRLLGVEGPDLPAGSGAPDPRRLLELALWHQVGALAYHSWKTGPAGDTGRAEIPPEVQLSFRQAFLHHAMRNEALATSLAELAGALAARGIEALVFKGPWLAFHAYPDPGTRPVDDIDLGIHERDYRAALEVLTALGYRSDGELPSTPEEALRRAHFGRQLRFSARGRRPLELHFRMVNLGPPAAEERWLWEHTRKLDVGGQTIGVPGPEAMLLHVLLHANQHGFAVLRLLFDVRYTLDRIGAELDTEAFLAVAQEQRLASSAYHGLQLAHELAGADVAPALLAALRPGPLGRARFAWLWNTVAARALEAPRRALEHESPRLYLLEMGDLADKASYLRGIVREAGGMRALLRRSRSIAARGTSPSRSL